VTSGVRVPPLVLLLVAMHAAVFPHLRIDGVDANVLLLATITAAIVGGPERGAWMGFAAGFGTDLFLHSTPFGLSMLTFAMVGWFVGVFQTRVLHAVWWIPMLTAAVATALGTLAFVGLGAVLGQDQLVSGRLVPIVGVTALWSALLAPAGTRVMRWAFMVDSARAGLVRVL
jgi:rod shape-determining protein MreD